MPFPICLLFCCINVVFVLDRIYGIPTALGLLSFKHKTDPEIRSVFLLFAVLTYKSVTIVDRGLDINLNQYLNINWKNSIIYFHQAKQISSEVAQTTCFGVIPDLTFSQVNLGDIIYLSLNSYIFTSSIKGFLCIL